MIALVLIISVFGTVGCEEKVPAEKAGKKLDAAAKDPMNKMNDMLDK
jgi:hypothetical protein